MMWRCDYCGQQQNTEARKCVDCGGPRAELSRDTRRWENFADGRYFLSDGELQAYLTNERIKAQNALNDTINEARETIGGAFYPILRELADKL